MGIDVETFKQVLGCWASGVTIVTARAGEQRHGMTVSAFCSVSADPPQVLVCANKDSNTQTLIERGRVYTVSILAEGQDELSNLFADKSREDERFDGLDCVDGASGCPRIPGALAWVDCRVSQAIEAGTHVIYVGAVEAAEISDRAPLGFYRGRYKALR
jgi:flavin reductase (DIM6/NTAB) family NADH-FMN oxidoreductase RutF